MTRNRTANHLSYIFKFVTLIFALFLAQTFFSNLCFGAAENLDEMHSRKLRHSAAAWGPDYVEDSKNYYIWQPETLCYYDLKTNHEVWRMTNTLNEENFISNITWPQFSADGKRFGFSSSRDSNAPGVGVRKNPIWMVSNINGSNMRPPTGSPTIIDSSINDYFVWSPTEPDIRYAFGPREPGFEANILYKISINDNSLKSSPYISFPTSFDSAFLVGRNISSDGRVLVVVGYQTGRLYPAIIYPEDSKEITVRQGYPLDRGWGDGSIQPKWGSSPKGSFNGYHASPHVVHTGDYMYFQHAAGNAKWKMKILNGSASDGGPKYYYDPSQSNPYDRFKNPKSGLPELIPINTKGNIEDPFGGAYWSHPAHDRWDRYVAFSNGNDTGGKGQGVGIWDKKDLHYEIKSFGTGAQHHNWHAWSDWSVSSSGPVNGSYLGDRIYAQNYYNPNSQIVVSYTHTRYNDRGATKGDYEALTRPTQSPDGTKVMFHSTFLNSKPGEIDSRPDIYIAVVYYPHPPQITLASASSGTVKIRFDWRLNSNSPRGYTDRGWPDEDNDISPPPKETKLFRLWRSGDRSPWKAVGIKFANIFKRFDFVHGGFKDGQKPYWEIADNPGPGTWYYAVTSLEHSGLESRTLSNIWKITINNSGNIDESVNVAAYPRNPGGIKPFYRKPPLAPADLTVTKKRTPGHYLMTWKEPNNFMIRYYNIYYSTNGVPPVDRRYRIASIPVGHEKWLDWNANPSKKGYYLITSIDYQGNESDDEAGGGGGEPLLRAPADGGGEREVQAPAGLRIIGAD